MQPGIDPAKAELQRTFRIAALAVLFFSLEDWLIVGHFAHPALAVRAAWAASLVALSMLIPEADARLRERLLTLAGTGSVVFYSAVVLLTGGSHGQNILWIACLPLAVTLLSSGNRRATLATCLTTLAATVMLVLAEHGDPRAVIAALGEVFAACVIAGYAVGYFARLRTLEQDELRRRSETLAQLALSEKWRAESEQLALIGRVASGVADEIARPLSFVSSNIEYVKQVKALGERLSPGDYERLLVETSQGVERARQLVRDLWAFAGGQSNEGVTELCQLGEVLDEALRLASFRLRNVGRIEKQIAPDLPAVRANSQRLTHVLVNLLVNAADALGELRGRGGCVRVVVQAVEGGQVEVLVEDDRPTVESLAPGRAASGEFALSLSKVCVERLGGQMVASEGGGGARFAVRLPVGIPENPVARA
jgi:C4-dicarboxylate-specific signal transduction histidine kinase